MFEKDNKVEFHHKYHLINIFHALYLILSAAPLSQPKTVPGKILTLSKKFVMTIIIIS